MKRLLDVLREDLHLTGTKEGCGEGECGSCSVRMNGELVNSCLVPVLAGRRRDIQTVEGLALERRTASAAAGIPQCGGAQCGICTPGMLMAAAHLSSAIPPQHGRDSRRAWPAISAAAPDSCASSNRCCSAAAQTETKPTSEVEQASHAR
jgi:aerobic-type carbon monoxide dehydrogenase small subunit (CoxS/CutS family)